MDADFAGCTTTLRATLGMHSCVRGPNTCFPSEPRSCARLGVAPSLCGSCGLSPSALRPQRGGRGGAASAAGGPGGSGCMQPDNMVKYQPVRGRPVAPQRTGNLSPGRALDASGRGIPTRPVASQNEQTPRPLFGLFLLDEVDLFRGGHTRRRVAQAGPQERDAAFRPAGLSRLSSPAGSATLPDWTHQR